MDDEGMPSRGLYNDRAECIHSDDEPPSREHRHPGPPLDNETSEHTISGDGLYLRLDSELYRLDDPRGLEELGDRDGVVAVALCELAITRLINSKCRCRRVS